MKALPTTFRLVQLGTLSLLATAAPSYPTVVVFDDHFAGDTGAVPTGWSGSDEGSVVESGTTVTLVNDCVIWTDLDFDPDSAGRTILRPKIESTTTHTGGGLVDPQHLDNHFWIKVHAQNGMIEVKASDVSSGEEEYVVGWIPGYSGGAVEVTTILDSDSFQLSTDLPAVSWGPIRYDAVFSTFTREDLGHTAKLVLESECSPSPPPCASAYDRLALEVGAPTSVDPTSWAVIKNTYRD